MAERMIVGPESAFTAIGDAARKILGTEDKMYMSDAIELFSSIGDNTYEGQEIYPGKTDIVLPANSLLKDEVVVKGDENLTADNIAEGVSIFGVLGSYEGSGGESGGNAPFTGEFASITDNGMYEPGVNEYVFDYSNCDVDLSGVMCLLVGGFNGTNYNCCFYREDSSDSQFSTISGNSNFAFGTHMFNINQTAKTITAYGSINQYYLTNLSFRAYFS